MTGPRGGGTPSWVMVLYIGEGRGTPSWAAIAKARSEIVLHLQRCVVTLGVSLSIVWPRVAEYAGCLHHQ